MPMLVMKFNFNWGTECWSRCTASVCRVKCMKLRQFHTATVVTYIVYVLYTSLSLRSCQSTLLFCFFSSEKIIHNLAGIVRNAKVGPWPGECSSSSATTATVDDIGCIDFPVLSLLCYCLFTNIIYTKCRLPMKRNRTCSRSTFHCIQPIWWVVF